MTSDPTGPRSTKPSSEETARPEVASPADGSMEPNQLSFAIGYLQSVCRDSIPASLRHRIGESDLIQETLLGATLAIGQFRGQNIDSFRVWLREIFQSRLHNLVRDHIRCQKRSVCREERRDPVNLAQGQSSLTQLIEREAVAQEQLLMNQTFLQLSTSDRQIIELHSRQGLPFASIANMMRLSEPAVRKRYTRAIGRWRILVERLSNENL